MTRFELAWMLFWAVIEWGPWVGAAGLVLTCVGIAVILRHRQRTWSDESLLEPLADMDEVVYTPGAAQVVQR